MSIFLVKTTGYADLIEAFCLVLDLYEKGDRSSKIDTKHSFSTKKKILNRLIFQRIIEGLHLKEPLSKEFIYGAITYFEILIQHINSLPTLYHQTKNDTLTAYKNRIFPPMLAIVAFNLFKIEKENEFYITLDELLIHAASNEQVIDEATFLIKKKLASIINTITNGNDDYLPIVELMKNIRRGICQRRETINQKFDIILRNTKPSSQVDNGDKCKKLREAYHCCMSMIRFNNRTGLFFEVAKSYNKITKDHTKSIDYLDFTAISDIMATLGSSSNQNPSLQSSGMSTANINDIIANESNTLLGSIQNNFLIPQDKNIIFLTSALWKVLRCNLINHNLATPNLADILDKYGHGGEHLKPLKFIMEFCILVQKGCLSEAIKKLNHIDALCLEKVSPELLNMTTCLYIGCHIKEGRVSHHCFEPLIKIILDTQLLFSDKSYDDGALLKMNFESSLDDHYKSTLLRCVKKYNEIIFNFKGNHQGSAKQAILDSLDQVESTIQKLHILNDTPTYYSRLRKLIAKKLTKHEVNGNLIPFLPDATLYYCIRELLLLCQYLHFSPKRHPAIYLLTNNQQLRKLILKALNPTIFKKECIPEIIGDV